MASGTCVVLQVKSFPTCPWRSQQECGAGASCGHLQSPVQGQLGFRSSRAGTRFQTLCLLFSILGDLQGWDCCLPRTGTVAPPCDFCSSQLNKIVMFHSNLSGAERTGALLYCWTFLPQGGWPCWLADGGYDDRRDGDENDDGSQYSSGPVSTLSRLILLSPWNRYYRTFYIWGNRGLEELTPTATKQDLMFL